MLMYSVAAFQIIYARISRIIGAASVATAYGKAYAIT